MKTWIKNHWKLLSIEFLTLGLLISVLLGNKKLGVIFILLSLLWICVLAFLYVVKDFSDKKPLPLVDLRKVEKIKANNYLLRQKYNEETGRFMPHSLYLSTPDELAYIVWLELLSTKFLMLKENNTPLDSKLDYPDEIDKINMEDL